MFHSLGSVTTVQSPRGKDGVIVWCAVSSFFFFYHGGSTMQQYGTDVIRVIKTRAHNIRPQGPGFRQVYESRVRDDKQQEVCFACF